MRISIAALLLVAAGGPSGVQGWAMSASRPPLLGRRRLLGTSTTGLCANLLGGLQEGLRNPFAPPAAWAAVSPRSVGLTNEVVAVVEGIRQKRLGNSDIIVSEIGLGTQRWVSGDSNAPNEELCHAFLDRAVLKGGVNLVDTAEQYPIPSDRNHPEGLGEETIGRWCARGKGRREKLVISTKITGGRNVNRRNIRRDCEGSLRRLGTDYIDVYMLHWPARYTPQANWGQSLTYQHDLDSPNRASFAEVAQAMGELISEGKIRGWGLCNDNAYGLAASCAAAKALGVPPPVSMQNDFSIVNRRIEENGVSEASSAINENVGFMAYNALAGGFLTGKYSGVPPTTDNPDFVTAKETMQNPRGRHDEYGWGRTLYRYRTEAVSEALADYSALAKKNGMSSTELCLRWCKQRRSVTTTLLGHTSMAQLEDDLTFFHQKKQPLSPELMWEIDRVHMRNRLPIFSSRHVGADWDGEGEIGEPIP